jgi:predicted DNA-binding transcriptional regulator AlpA
VDRETAENHDDDPLLLLPEVAELCRMSESTLRWLRHKGEGPPAFRMGRRLKYRRSVVLEWVAKQEQAQQ